MPLLLIACLGVLLESIVMPLHHGLGSIPVGIDAYGDMA